MKNLKVILMVMIIKSHRRSVRQVQVIVRLTLSTTELRRSEIITLGQWKSNMHHGSRNGEAVRLCCCLHNFEEPSNQKKQCTCTLSCI